ncbi:MAG: rhomboid family intramembrane serine protease, partial [Planctomycetales bacterium]|nr:rhomboid family intramembrane serine protease [Planctomycetales bacterium]
VINVLVFGMMIAAIGTHGADVVEPYLLQFDTINPVQWVTTNFLHAGPMHLIGNMFFLWGFGLVVEGKLGWKRFIPLYLFLGIVYGAAMQSFAFVLGLEGAALGASSAIFGLLTIAILWAPANNMNCFLYMGVFSRTMELSVLAFGLFYVGLQIFFVVLQFIHQGGLDVSSEVLHIAGILVGLPVGVAMLKMQWVDCEGWDIFSRYFANTKLAAAVMGDVPAAVDRKSTADRQRVQVQREEQKSQAEMALNSFRQCLAAGHTQAALAIYNKVPEKARDKYWQLADKELLTLVKFLHHEKRWSDSVPFMVDLIKRAPDRTQSVRLKLAQILVQVEERPRQAMKVLEPLPTLLSESLEKQRRAIWALAQRKLREGVMEAPTQEW